MTRKEFEKEVKKLGLTTMDTETDTYVMKYIDETIPYVCGKGEYVTVAFVANSVYGAFNTNTFGIEDLDYEKRVKLIELCTKFSLTGMLEREY